MTTNSPTVPNKMIAPISVLSALILAFVYAHIDNSIALFPNAVIIDLAASITFGFLLGGIVHLSTSLAGFKDNKQKLSIPTDMMLANTSKLPMRNIPMT